MVILVISVTTIIGVIVMFMVTFTIVISSMFTDSPQIPWPRRRASGLWRVGDSGGDWDEVLGLGFLCLTSFGN